MEVWYQANLKYALLYTINISFWFTFPFGWLISNNKAIYYILFSKKDYLISEKVNMWHNNFLYNHIMNTFFIWKPLLNIRIKCHFTRAGYKANAFLIFVSVSNLPFNLSPLTNSDLKHGYDYGCGIWLLLKSEFNILVILDWCSNQNFNWFSLS